MSKYQSIPRTFRPQRFKDVYEQDTIIQILKNAISMDRCAHAYLFCGSRGSGKTTLARLFAKALNCKNLLEDVEPCNQCSSCLEITSSSSLDVLEIDGASNRGIDDVRQLSENTIYAPSSSKYKIYIIDEVHMLTKEAFNALLKTLEEPPKNVKFFFATTEPHKVLPTIISRCQRFDLKRISLESLAKKLRFIAKKLNVEIEEEALLAICDSADGSLRDAESLFDQILCLNTSHITYDHIANLLGILPHTTFIQLDEAIAKYDLSFAFSLTQKLYEEGKDFSLFLNKLIEHFQQLLKLKLGLSDFDNLSKKDLEQLKTSSKHFSKDKCLDICDYLLSQLELFRQTPLKKAHIELILLHLIRTSKALSVAEMSSTLLTLKNTLPKEDSKNFKEEIIEKVEDKPIEEENKSIPLQKLTEEEIKAVPLQKPIEENSQEPETQPPVQETVRAKHTQNHETLLRFVGVEFNGIVKKPS